MLLRGAQARITLTGSSSTPGNSRTARRVGSSVDQRVFDDAAIIRKSFAGVVEHAAERAIGSR